VTFEAVKDRKIGHASARSEICSGIVVQRRLDELRVTLYEDAISKLAARLNRPGKDRLAAMWEVAILHALSKLGDLGNEVTLASGRRPDVVFANGGLTFTADITTVSDDGLDEQNPYEELRKLIEACKIRLGLKIGGMDLRVGSRREQTARGTRTVLRLPDRRRLSEFVRDQIEPRLRQQIDEGKEVLHVGIEDAHVTIQVTVDPRKSPYSSGSYAAYDAPTIKDRNPLYNALRSKAGQVRGASGLLGVIVGDGDSRAFTDQQNNWSDVSARAIVDEFLRQYASVHFVLLLSVREERTGWSPVNPPIRRLHGQLVVSRTTAVPAELEQLFHRMMAEMPQPVAMPINAALRSREAGYGLGHHGGSQMSDRRIKLSAREVLEVLAGRRTVQEMNASHDWHAAADRPQARTKPNFFERCLQEGRLPSSITVIKTDENDSDDWIEVEFGDPDPAIRPFR
jgi:hypothetical protein